MQDFKMEKVNYLDHGFVELVDVLGDDNSIANAARTSYLNTQEKTDEENARLVSYLVEHNHTSPLEMAEMVFRIKMPIFVMRQHIRHRTANVNEQSLRYVVSDGDYYLPPVKRFKTSHKTNKQGSGDVMEEHIALTCQELIKDISDRAWASYNLLVKAGLSKEVSRMVLPVNFYTTCVWKMDLNNLLKYLSLRNDPHAQEEIQELAQIIEKMVEKKFPAVYSSYIKHKKDSLSFSAEEQEILKEYFSLSTEEQINYDWGKHGQRKKDKIYNKLGKIFNKDMI